MWLMGIIVRRYRDFLILFISTPLVLARFCSSIHTSFLIPVHFKNVFSFLFMLFLCNIANVQNIRDCSKIEIMWTWRYNYIDMHVEYIMSPETFTCEVPNDRLTDVASGLFVP